MGTALLEKIFIFIVDILVCCFAAWLFYDNIPAGIILSAPFYYLIRKAYMRMKNRKRTREFERQFEEALSSLVSALQTGYSVENSFFEITRQLALIYGKDAYIIRELRVICHGLSVNVPVEKLMDAMAVRTGVPSVSAFAEVLAIAKKRGGNFIEVTKQHAAILHEKRQVLNEIETAVSAKRCESIVMNIMPAGMLLYLRMTSGQFADVLYSGIISVIVMTALLCMYIITIALGRHITDMERNSAVYVSAPLISHNKKRGGGRCAAMISAKLYSILKSSFLSFHIEKINNEITGLHINAGNADVIKSFWDTMIKKTVAGIAASSALITYALLCDRNNTIFYCVLSGVVIYAVPYSVVGSLKAKSEKRKRQMMLDYPELIDRLSLLIGAGLSIKGCFKKLAEEYALKRENGLTGYHYLYEEIMYMARQLDNGRPEAVVYEEFGRRSGILAYMKLCTMLTQNLRKGTRDILDKLKLTSLDALEERRNIMKTMGEKASSKLLLPMMLQFIMILVIIMYPAVVSM